MKQLATRPMAALILAAVASWGTEPARSADQTGAVAIKAETLYVGDGQKIRQAVVLIRDGKIAAVGNELSLPKDVEVLEIPGGCLTAGLIDANAHLESQDMIEVSPRWLRRDAEASGEGAEPREEVHGLPLAGLVGPPRHVDAGPVDAEFIGQPGHVEEGDEEHDEEHEPLVSGVRAGAVVTEQSSEVVPHIRVLDALELSSRDFQRLVRGGVTTVYASPDPSAVIGARGAIVRTAGPADARVLREAASVKATIGSEPGSLGTYNRPPSRSSSTMYNRRPNSRMGLVWVFRKSFYDAIRRKEGLPVYGADAADAEAHAVLQDVLQGRVSLRIQARVQRDILAALRLADEFQLSFMLEEASEAYRCLDEIKACGAAVIFGPISRRSASRDRERPRYYTFRALLEHGIPTALSAQDLRDEDGLARQAMYAQRFGVSFDQALRAVTLTPAELLGLDDRLGSVHVGKRADLVLWSGRPLAADSQPVLVLIEGRIVVDRR